MKSNEDQYKAATELLESLEDAKHSLESNDVQKTQQAIEEVAGRQRLVQDVFKGVFFSFILLLLLSR